MIPVSLILFCTAVLLFFLLEDRFSLWVTLAGAAGGFLLALGVGALGGRLGDAGLSRQLSCAWGLLALVLVSLVLYRNNVLQKLFLALLALASFAFLDFFCPLALGALPFSPTGAFGALFPPLCTLLLFLLLGLCLYRPVRHFSDRGVSGFLVGMCLAAVLLYVLSLGRLDLLFRTHVHAARLLAAVLVYGGIIFCFRSLYQAGRFRERTAANRDHEQMLQMELDNISGMMTGLREVRAAQKSGEYALETVNSMLLTGSTEQIAQYIKGAKENAYASPMLASYHENPYLNAVIAVKAAFAAHNEIAFESNVAVGESPLTTGEICVIVNELLARACQDAAEYPGKRRLRLTVQPAGETLRFEVVYTGALPEEEQGLAGLKGKTAAELIRLLVEDDGPRQDSLYGLDNTRNILARCHGKLSVAASGQDEIILQADVRR